MNLARSEFESWIARYVELWRTEGTAGLSELFGEDAAYFTNPYEQPHKGLEAIKRMWDAEREGPGEAFEFGGEIVAVEGDTGVARIDVRYGAPRDQEYRDLWIVRFGEDGRCVRFEEWPFWPPGSDGQIAAGAG